MATFEEISQYFKTNSSAAHGKKINQKKNKLWKNHYELKQKWKSPSEIINGIRYKAVACSKPRAKRRWFLRPLQDDYRIPDFDSDQVTLAALSWNLSECSLSVQIGVCVMNWMRKNCKTVSFSKSYCFELFSVPFGTKSSLTFDPAQVRKEVWR